MCKYLEKMYHMSNLRSLTSSLGRKSLNKRAGAWRDFAEQAMRLMAFKSGERVSGSLFKCSLIECK